MINSIGKIPARCGFVRYGENESIQSWSAIAAYDNQAELEHLYELMEKDKVHTRSFETSKGQVKGKGKGKIQAIDADHSKFAFIGIGKLIEGSEILRGL